MKLLVLVANYVTSSGEFHQYPVSKVKYPLFSSYSLKLGADLSLIRDVKRDASSVGLGILFKFYLWSAWISFKWGIISYSTSMTEGAVHAQANDGEGWPGGQFAKVRLDYHLAYLSTISFSSIYLHRLLERKGISIQSPSTGWVLPYILLWFVMSAFVDMLLLCYWRLYFVSGLLPTTCRSMESQLAQFIQFIQFILNSRWVRVFIVNGNILNVVLPKCFC